MKVLFISNLFPDATEPYRGLDNSIVLHHLAQWYEIRVIAPRPTLPFRKQPRTPRPEDVGFRPIFPPAFYAPKCGSRVNHLLFASALRRPVEAIRREFNFDLILCAWAYPDACAVARFASRWKIPFITITQGTDVHTYLQNPVRRRLIKTALNQASAVVTRSRNLARLLEGAGVKADKLHAITNGVDADVFNFSDKSAARRELQLPKDADIILFVGNFYPVKDPLLTVTTHAAFARLNPARTRLLLMLGGGPMEPAIRETAEKLGIEQSVVLAGRQSPHQVARYMQAADCLLLNSHNEGLPNVILEAITCGLPVVATNVGGISEVITSPEHGACVDGRSAEALAEQIEAVLASRVQSRASAQGQTPFDWQQTATRYYELAQRAIQQERSTRLMGP